MGKPPGQGVLTGIYSQFDIQSAISVNNTFKRFIDILAREFEACAGPQKFGSKWKIQDVHTQTHILAHGETVCKERLTFGVFHQNGLSMIRKAVGRVPGAEPFLRFLISFREFEEGLCS